jgi:ketosteroid isomerase-like protein
VDRSSLDAASAAFHEALRTDDADTLFTHVTDDVILMPPGEAPVRGKNAMRDWYVRFLSAYRTTSLLLDNKEVQMGDDWGVETGSFEWGLAPAAGAGEPITDRGSYMQVWKRESDGQWRFAREIYNSSSGA